MKTRFAMLVGSVCVLFTFACSDSTSLKRRTPSASPVVITPTGTLDQNIIQILTLFPKGLETAATTRWGNVKSKYAAGLSDPSQMAVAKQMAFELSDWVNKKAPNMDTPPDGETRVSAATRAIQYMLLYVYGPQGPNTPVPPYNPAADAIVGLVTPGAPATVVTPSGHAGVQFEAGSVAENTVIVVSQNLLIHYSANCSGPLQTLLCQYPQFYNFDQFPHKKLLKGAKFSVCHVNNVEDPRHPLADHDRFRLAHSKPANPADYTPGSTIRDQFGESIEILPLVTGQTFVICPHDEIIYASALGTSDGLFSRLARGVMSALTPKSAYAIDQGGGGVSFFFSPFNDVDPDGRPDRAVQSLTVTPACGVDCAVHPGTELIVNFTIANIGTATTGDGAPGLIQLTQPAIEGPPIVFPLGAFSTGPALAPGGSVVFSQHVVIPNTVPAGNYNVQVTVGIGFFPEVPADLANNSATIPITITSLLGQYRANALNDFGLAFRGTGAGSASEGQVTYSALLSDEFLHAETFSTRLDIDRRSILADNLSVRGVFRDLQQARASLDFAISQSALASPTTDNRSDLLATAGFSNILVAENWCSGVPISQLNPAGAVVYGPQQTTSQVLASAISKFDSAIALASTNPDHAPTVNVALLGKARALLDMNDPAGAAAAAVSVPTGFAWTIAADNGPVGHNGIFELMNVQHLWTVSDNEGGNGLPYRSEADPRILFAAAGVGFDGSTPLFVQLKYASFDSRTPLGLGLEARLIEAEASLRSGDLASFTASVNIVRAVIGLVPLTIPATATEARDILFKERAYDMWLTSHRLGDLRRLVRQYDRGQSSVFPTGEYPKGGVYGSDVNFPIPVDATFNPGGLACFDRNP